MKVIGIVTLTVILAVILVAAVVGIRSVPDLQRYRKIRKM